MPLIRTFDSTPKCKPAIGLLYKSGKIILVNLNLITLLLNLYATYFRKAGNSSYNIVQYEPMVVSLWSTGLEVNSLKMEVAM